MLKILILEDYFPLQRELVELVEKMGHVGIGASDAATAKDVLKKSDVDAMIVDFFIKEDGKFSKEGGLSMIVKVRRQLEPGLKIARDAPILAISGGFEIEGGYSPLRTSRDLGANAWLKKPLDFDEVAVWISEVDADLRQKDQERRS